MKRLPFIVFALGVLAIAAVFGVRLATGAGSPGVLDVPPGEGRFDQPDEIFSGLFRSWSLSGTEAENAAQAEAFLRLGTVRGSKMARLELRRRELEVLLADARSNLKKVQVAQTFVTPPTPVETTPPAGSEEETVTDESAGEVKAGEVESEPAVEATAPPVDENYDDTGDGEYGDTGDEYSQAGYEEEPMISPEEEAAQESLARLESEYGDVIAGLDEVELAKEKARLSEVAVLAGGASRGAQALLARWGQPFRMVQAGPGLSGISGTQPVLIVPSGAMQKGAKSGLNGFVRSGGTIIAFSQPYGRQLSLLPGRPSGVGWAEAESRYENAVQTVAAHPALVSCPRNPFTAAVDGFFTELPKNAEVLLRDPFNGRPVVIAYPVGKGLVIATTLFTDWETMSRPPADGEYRLVRDLLLWAVARGRRLHPDTVQSGTKYVPTLTIENRTKEMAKRIRLAYLTPEGALCKPFDIDVRVLPGEVTQRQLHLTAPSAAGVWHVVYCLLRPDGSVLQYWRNGVDVVSGSLAPTPPPVLWGAAVTTAGENLPAEREISFALHLWNGSGSSISVTCSGPGGQQMATVPANGTKKVTFRCAAGNQSTLGYYEFVVTGPGGETRLSRLVRTTSNRKGVTQ